MCTTYGPNGQRQTATLNSEISAMLCMCHVYVSCLYVVFTCHVYVSWLCACWSVMFMCHVYLSCLCVVFCVMFMRHVYVSCLCHVYVSWLCVMIICHVHVSCLFHDYVSSSCIMFMCRVYVSCLCVMMCHVMEILVSCADDLPIFGGSALVVNPARSPPVTDNLVNPWSLLFFLFTWLWAVESFIYEVLGSRKFWLRGFWQ